MPERLSPVAEIILHYSIIETDRDLMLYRVDAFHGPDVSIENLFVVVVLSLDHLIAPLELPSEPLDARLVGLNWIQHLL